MKALRRFRSPLAKLSNYNRIISVRHKFIVSGIRDVRPKNLPAIPDVDKLWKEYCSLEVLKENARKRVLDELIQECNIKDSPEQQSAKMEILKTSINTLVEQNMVPSLNAVVDGLLGHLEPFPYDHSETLANMSVMSIRHVKRFIEKQYLAWKFKAKVEEIEINLHKYKLSFFEFQSLTNLRRNCDAIEDLPATYQLNVAEKIYHVHQIPFNMSLILNFQETLVGLNWDRFSQYCPKILQHSYYYIIFLISKLQKMQFTDTQIREALPFLHKSFFTLLYTLNLLLTHPELSKYRSDDKFLQLLFYSTCVLGNSLDFQKYGFSELIDMIRIQKQVRSYHPVKFILQCVRQFYEIDPSCMELLKRHPMRRYVSEDQILDTLNFLQANDFKTDEVTESITIILYPRELIERTLQKIKEQETALKAYGFEKGCVPESTNFFEAGTKSRRKTLQLCLYYLEKPLNFSGYGVFDHKAFRKFEDTNQLERF